jgi:hypothetical protein
MRVNVEILAKYKKYPERSLFFFFDSLFISEPNCHKKPTTGSDGAIDALSNPICHQVEQFESQG